MADEENHQPRNFVDLISDYKPNPPFHDSGIPPTAREALRRDLESITSEEALNIGPIDGAFPNGWHTWREYRRDLLKRLLIASAGVGATATALKYDIVTNPNGQFLLVLASLGALAYAAQPEVSYGFEKVTDAMANVMFRVHERYKSR